MNTTTKTGKFTEITNLTDAALDVVLAVKAGAESVEVEHLTPAERAEVCKALGVEAPHYWIANAPYSEPTDGRRYCGPDFEALILAEQEADESRWT